MAREAKSGHPKGHREDPRVLPDTQADGGAGNGQLSQTAAGSHQGLRVLHHQGPHIPRLWAPTSLRAA